MIPHAISLFVFFFDLPLSPQRTQRVRNIIYSLSALSAVNDSGKGLMLDSKTVDKILTVILIIAIITAAALTIYVIITPKKGEE